MKSDFQAGRHSQAPRVIGTFDHYKFVFDDRFNSEEGYFRESGRKVDQRRWQTDFVADVMACQMDEGGRGIGVKSLGFAPKAGGKQYVYKSVKDGGDQIEYEEEDPAIHRDYEAALAQQGVTCKMGGKHPFCTAKAEAA